MEFSTAALHRIIRQQGDKRVSENAANQLGEILEKYAGDIAEEAVALAQEDGGDTIHQNHIASALLD